MLFKTLLFLVSIYIISAQCPSGTFRNATSNLCENCPAGTFSNTGGNGISTCLLCKAGTFSNQGGNCTTCVGGTCGAGSSEPLKEKDTLLLNLLPFMEINIQTLKVGFVFIPLLLTVFPLIVASTTCWTEEFFRIFDIFENNHLIADGAPRVKQRTGLGGCCFLMACAVFTVFLGASLVDFYFDNARRDSRLTISPDSTKTVPFGDYSYQATVKLLGVSAEHCHATYSTTGYNVLTNGTVAYHCGSSKVEVKSTTGNSNITQEHCYCSYKCTKCSIGGATTISFNFPSQRVFSSAIFFNYKTPFAGSYHQINGSILPPTDQVFYGPTETKVDITHFSSIFKGLLGGPNLAALVQFVDTFVNLHAPATYGVTTQVDLVTKGSSTTTLTGSGGVTFTVAGTFSKYDHIVEEFLTQTFIGHVGELVGIFVALLIIFFLIMKVVEHLIQFYEVHEKNGNVKRIKGIIMFPYNKIRTFIYVKLTGQPPKDSDSDEDEEDDEIEVEEETKIDVTSNDIAQLQHAVKLLTDKVAQMESKPHHHDAPIEVAKTETIDLNDGPKEEPKFEPRVEPRVEPKEEEEPKAEEVKEETIFSEIPFE